MPPMVAVAMLWGSSLVLAVRDDQPGTAPDPVQAALGELVRACVNTDWPAELAARTRLVSLGPKALPVLIESARHHDDWRVRRSCYQLLTDAYARDERAIGMAVRHGLGDLEPAVRYHCAFLLGDLRVADAVQDLRAAFGLSSGKDQELLRYTLAKSLAQLGQAEVMRDLFAAVTDDSFMPRHVGNIGLKALSGKCLNDFEGYDYAEGASVSGGIEAMTPFDALAVAEKKLARSRATVAYFGWLKAERPELYRHATYPSGARSPNGRRVR